MEDESMSCVRPPQRRSGSPKSVPVLITLRPISRNIASTSFHFSPLKDTAVTRETRWLVFMVYLKNLKICLTCCEAAKNFLTWTKYLDDAVVWSRKDVIALASFTFKDKKTGNALSLQQAWDCSCHTSVLDLHFESQSMMLVFVLNTSKTLTTPFE